MISQRSVDKSHISAANENLYDKWAEQYDTDGNILQAIDEQEILSLLDLILKELERRDGPKGKVKVTELGCGTGRNTVKLLDLKYQSYISHLCALDLSSKMLERARYRCENEVKRKGHDGDVLQPDFHVLDILSEQASQAQVWLGSEIVMATLVLEHLPLTTFFKWVKSVFVEESDSGLLRDNTGNSRGQNPRYLLLTNMHHDMGKQSQAGFLDLATGEKMRGTSFVYDIKDVVAEAEEFGFKILHGGEMKERGVTESDVEMLGKRGRKWVGCKVWYGCVFVFP